MGNKFSSYFDFGSRAHDSLPWAPSELIEIGSEDPTLSQCCDAGWSWVVSEVCPAVVEGVVTGTNVRLSMWNGTVVVDGEQRPINFACASCPLRRRARFLVEGTSPMWVVFGEVGGSCSVCKDRSHIPLGRAVIGKVEGCCVYVPESVYSVASMRVKGVNFREDKDLIAMLADAEGSVNREVVALIKRGLVPAHLRAYVVAAAVKVAYDDQLVFASCLRSIQQDWATRTTVTNAWALRSTVMEVVEGVVGVGVCGLAAWWLTRRGVARLLPPVFPVANVRRAEWSMAMCALGFGVWRAVKVFGSYKAASVPKLPTLSRRAWLPVDPCLGVGETHSANGVTLEVTGHDTKQGSVASVGPQQGPEPIVAANDSAAEVATVITRLQVGHNELYDPVYTQETLNPLLASHLFQPHVDQADPAFAEFWCDVWKETDWECGHHFDKWNSRFPKGKQTKNVGALKALRQYGLTSKDSVRTLTIKNEVLPADADKRVEGVKPRAISEPVGKVKVADGPWMWCFGKLLAWHWDGVKQFDHPCDHTSKIVPYYHSGHNANDLGAIYSAAINSGATYCAEVDGKAWDTTMTPALLEFERGVYSKLPSWRGHIRKAFDLKVGRRVGYFRSTKVTFDEDAGQRNSGDSNTSCGNSLINMAAAITSIKVRPHSVTYVFVLGDDMLALSTEPLVVDEDAYGRLGVRPEVSPNTDAAKSTFCSGVFYKIGHGKWIWGPTPHRLIGKMGRAVGLDPKSDSQRLARWRQQLVGLACWAYVPYVRHLTAGLKYVKEHEFASTAAPVEVDWAIWRASVNHLWPGLPEKEEEFWKVNSPNAGAWKARRLNDPASLPLPKLE